MLEFGARDPDCEYIERPGAYAVIFDDDRQQVALIRTRRCYFLPGGGALPGETPAREVAESSSARVDEVNAVDEADGVVMMALLRWEIMAERQHSQG